MSVRLSVKYEMLSKQRQQQMQKLSELINRKNNLDSLHSLVEVNEEDNKSEEDCLINASKKINFTIMKKFHAPQQSFSNHENKPDSREYESQRQMQKVQSIIEKNEKKFKIKSLDKPSKFYERKMKQFTNLNTFINANGVLKYENLVPENSEN